jgi:hypothetical protein
MSRRVSLCAFESGLRASKENIKAYSQAGFSPLVNLAIRVEFIFTSIRGSNCDPFVNILFNFSTCLGREGFPWSADKLRSRCFTALSFTASDQAAELDNL